MQSDGAKIVSVKMLATAVVRATLALALALALALTLALEVVEVDEEAATSASASAWAAEALNRLKVAESERYASDPRRSILAVDFFVDVLNLIQIS